MEDDPQLNGVGSVADYVQNGGGSGSPYIANQDPYSANDDGALNSTAATTTTNGTATGTPTGTTGSSTSGLPSWFSNILSTAGNAAGTALTQTVTPIVNNKPATSPAPVTGQVAKSGGMSSTTIMLIVAAVLAFLFLGKKRSA